MLPSFTSKSRLRLLISLAGLALMLIIYLTLRLTRRDPGGFVVRERINPGDWTVRHAHQDEVAQVPLAATVGDKVNIGVYTTRQGRSTKNIKDADWDIVRLSESTNILERGKFQMQQVDKYCQERGGRLGGKFQLPTIEDEKQLLYRHLLYDDNREAMFCFVEKIGCTDMKRMWFVSVGDLPLRTINDEWVDLKYLEKGIRRASLLNKSLNEPQRINMIKNFYKFMIIRHPLERLVSGFRNKIEPPLVDLSERFPNYIKLTILQRYRSKEFHDWMEHRTSDNLTVTFEEFILYFVNSDLTKINPHIKPVIYSCHPCRVRYDFYGNFHTYSQDAHMAMDKLRINSTFYRDKSLHPSSQRTTEYLGKYYNQLSATLKYRLYQKLVEEIEFYYTLFPRERNSHINILEISGAS